MNKIIVSAILLSAVCFGCGPAAEDRDKMHERAKVIADSMATLIKAAMAEAESPPNVIVVPDTSKKAANNAQPNK